MRGLFRSGTGQLHYLFAFGGKPRGPHTTNIPEQVARVFDSLVIRTDINKNILFSCVVLEPIARSHLWMCTLSPAIYRAKTMPTWKPPNHRHLITVACGGTCKCTMSCIAKVGLQVLYLVGVFGLSKPFCGARLKTKRCTPPPSKKSASFSAYKAIFLLMLQ